MNGRVCVIFYHRINEVLFDQHHLCVSPKNFDQHMRYLKKNYNILRFEEDWRDADQDSVVVTFDDGYLDNYENAIPILNELEIPATIFVSSSYLKGDREFWWDELETILLLEDIPKTFCLEDREYGCRWRTKSLGERLNCYKAVRRMMMNLTNYEKRCEWMNQLWEWSGYSRHTRMQNQTITDAICKEMSEMKNITIGNHTVSHPALGSLGWEDQMWEIRESKKYLEELTGKKIETLSYPLGSYNEDTGRICSESGIKKAATIVRKLWEPQKSLYEIPRFCIQDWNLWQFKAELEKTFQM